MDGHNKKLKTNIYVGYAGEYQIKELIGQGGNGKVYKAIKKGDESKEYAIKVLCVNDFQRKERKKRFLRFRNEIDTVCKLTSEEQIDGIMPILDYSKADDKVWYLMPEAKKYCYNEYSLIERIDQVIRLARIIKSLHDCGYSHRDIKPGNLLFYDNELYLADFGLIHNMNDLRNLTNQGDVMGPSPIRPPELWNITILDCKDYRPSDVYLFAKTVWIILTGQKYGFQGRYSRVSVKQSLSVQLGTDDTLEPLHRLLEEATCDDMGKRINIDQCLELLELQKAVFTHAISQEKIQALRHEEQVKLLICEGRFDEMKYTDTARIVNVLQRFVNEEISFVEFDVCEEQLLFRKAVLGESDTVELWLAEAYQATCIKKLCVSVTDVVVTRDCRVGVHINKHGSLQGVEGFCNITDAMKSKKQRVFLRGNYELVIDKKQHPGFNNVSML